MHHTILNFGQARRPRRPNLLVNLIIEAKNLNNDKEKALQKIITELRTIQDQINDFKQMEAKYKDSNTSGAKITMIALAEFEQESQR